MQLANGSFRLSPSDLTAFLVCEHLTRLEMAAARGEVERPSVENPEAELIKRKGEEHEAAYLAVLRKRGLRVEEIQFDFDWQAAAEATASAIRVST